MRKSTRIVKRALALFLVVLMSINTLGAIVSDNDGSAFITKAEFDSLKNDFQSQIDRYSSSIDNKLDGAIASYLAGIRTAIENTEKNLCYAEGGILSVRADDADIKWTEGFIYLEDYHYQIFNRHPAIGQELDGISIGYAEAKSHEAKPFLEPALVSVDRTKQRGVWGGLRKTSYALRSNSFDRNTNYNRNEFIKNDHIAWSHTEMIGNANISGENKALWVAQIGYFEDSGDYKALNNMTAKSFNTSIARTIHEVSETNIILTPMSSHFARFVDYDQYKDWCRDNDLNGHTIVTSAKDILKTFSYVVSSATIDPPGWAAYNLNKITTDDWDGGNWKPGTGIGEAYPFWGFALEISNWNQVASPNLDSVATLLADYTTTNRIYKDSDGVNHLLICAGTPICEVKAGDVVAIDMEFEDKTKSYDVWFSMNGWERGSSLDGSSNVLSRDNIFLDKSLTQKASNGSFGAKSVSALNGSKKFYVRVPEKGVLFVKWSLSGNGGVGGGKYLPKDKVLVISE